MSIEENATYGKVSVMGLNDLVYLSHPITNRRPNSDLSYHLHCMALNKEEALHLIESLQMWMRLLNGN